MDLDLAESAGGGQRGEIKELDEPVLAARCQELAAWAERHVIDGLGMLA